MCAQPKAGHYYSVKSYSVLLGYAALIGYIWVVRAAAAAAVGIEEEGRFNFGRSADYPWPQAKKKL